MLIKRSDRVINLNRVNNFDKAKDKDLDGYTIYIIEFNFDKVSVRLRFESQEKRDAAFERILEDHRGQRQQCTLD